jgi:uncharacterized membrane protein YfcA
MYSKERESLLPSLSLEARMARDKGSQRLFKFWFASAFTCGIAVGAFSLAYLRAQGTLWIVLFFGAIAGAIAIFEQFGKPHGHNLRTPAKPSRWSRRTQPFHPVTPRKPVNTKPAARRAQLHAITGKKSAEPPSSSTS